MKISIKSKTMLKTGQKRPNRPFEGQKKSQTLLAVLLFLCHKKTSRGRWGLIDTFLHFQPLLLYFESKQAQTFSHNKATLSTQYHAKT